MDHQEFQIDFQPADELVDSSATAVNITTSQESLQTLLDRLMSDEEVAVRVVNHQLESVEHIFVYQADPPQQLTWKQALVDKLIAGAMLIGIGLPLYTIIAAIAVCIIVGACSIFAWCFQLVGLLI